MFYPEAAGNAVSGYFFVLFALCFAFSETVLQLLIIFIITEKLFMKKGSIKNVYT
jgi:hypothetical protein